MADNNFAFEKSKMPQVIDIIQRNAIKIVRIDFATNEQDTKQATDLAITIKGGAVGVRVRRFRATSNGRVFRDFTIRCESFYGFTTEIDKLRDGWGDFYLYAWEDANGAMDEYMFLDLHKVRSVGLLDPCQAWFQQLIPNVGDPTKFCAIPLCKLLEHECVLVHTIKNIPDTTTSPRAPLLHRISKAQSRFDQMRLPFSTT